jgi:hypothetical protein
MSIEPEYIVTPAAEGYLRVLRNQRPIGWVRTRYNRPGVRAVARGREAYFKQLPGAIAWLAGD